jgi:hypothetical protein
LYILALSFTHGVPNNQYREDYVYNEKNKVFYKLHIESVSYEVARNVCEVEGASLMVPSSLYDTVFVHGLLKDYPDIGNVVWVGDDGAAHDEDDEEKMENRK